MEVSFRRLFFFFFFWILEVYRWSKERRRDKRKKTREKKEDERKERRREKGKKTREREEAADLVLVSKKKLRLDFRPNSPPTPLPPPNSIECSVFEHEITKKILFVKFTAAS